MMARSSPMPSNLATRAAEQICDLFPCAPGVPVTQIAARIDAELAPVREALENLRKRIRCSDPDHQKLRHPLCGDCQTIGDIKNALANLEVK